MPKLSNGWTGGQYSIVRFVLGFYLFVHFAMLLPWGMEMFSNRGVLPESSLSPLVRLFPNPLGWADSPLSVTMLLVGAVLASTMLALGIRDRVAALVAWFAWACLFGRNPLISNPSIPFVGWMLLAHAILPRAPFGSMEARGRVDPGNGWQFPKELFAAAWIVMAVAYTYSGYTKLISPSWVDGTAFSYVLRSPLARTGPLHDLLLALPPFVFKGMTWFGLAAELTFAPLALSRRARPFIWTVLVGMHLGLLCMVSFADLTLGMLVLHLFTFNPEWVPGTRSFSKNDVVFYDGSCGICQGAVRFILAETGGDERFAFAPLDGETCHKALPRADYKALPDSIVVFTADSLVYTKSTAVLYIMKRLGGLWRVLATVGSLVPTRLADAVYDFVAKIRYKLADAPKDVCPLLPPALRKRFMP